LIFMTLLIACILINQFHMDQAFYFLAAGLWFVRTYARVWLMMMMDRNRN